MQAKDKRSKKQETDLQQIKANTGPSISGVDRVLAEFKKDPAKEKLWITGD